MINGQFPEGSGGDTQSLTALHCRHRLKSENAFAAFGELKLDSSVHKTYLVSSVLKWKVIYPICNQLTQTPAQRSLFSSMDFKWSTWQWAQTHRLTLKSMNCSGHESTQDLLPVLTPCSLSQRWQSASSPVSVSLPGQLCEQAWGWMLLSDLPSMHILLMHNSAVALCNNQNHACHRSILQFSSDLFKQL